MAHERQRTDAFQAEALRLLEAAQESKDRGARIELIRLAAMFHELAGGSLVDFDALLAQLTEPAVLQQQTGEL